MNERQRRQIEQLNGDQRIVRTAAATLLAAPAEAALAALSDPHVAACCSAILDVLANELGTVPAQVRDHTVRICRELTGDTMDDPIRRRTRRR